MVEIPAGRRIIRFGAFEADMQTGELRKNGVKLKLSGQPFQVLAMLLERPGDVVTRKEFQNRLWPDTFVDFEDNLNTAVNKIREALGGLGGEFPFCRNAASPGISVHRCRRADRAGSRARRTGKGQSVGESQVVADPGRDRRRSFSRSGNLVPAPPAAAPASRR